MTLVVYNGPVIDAGQSLSNAVDCSGGLLARITMPAEWDSANVTFAVSSDGEFFNDLVEPTGEAVQCGVKAGAAIMIPANWSLGIGWIKFRSGTAKKPIPQKARREFSVAIRTYQPGPLDET